MPSGADDSPGSARAPSAGLRLTGVPIFPDGTVAVIRVGNGGFTLPSGDVQSGEDLVLSATLRILLETAGFRRQAYHEFAREGSHVFVWCEGDVYRGNRAHTKAPLEIGEPAVIVELLRDAGRNDLADIVAAAAESYRTIDLVAFHAEQNRQLERIYLLARTNEGGSGFGGTPEEWRAARQPITDGIDHDGTFLDVGCANGLLMESVKRWCAERRTVIEPYGVDLAPGLVTRARERLPHWAHRIWLGDAATWVHPEDTRFDYVHTLLDSVPRDRRGDLVRHLIGALVRPGGRLLVSHYIRSAERDRTAGQQLLDLGLTVVGESRPRPDAPGSPSQTAWIDAP